ncbi:PilZ domain-containing protein [Oceanicoccus sagamiensis]|uniref:PilZ domain-containing protein n=1 Tax=Oceanicoccus sagamiensis TaxID=716816 RepID=A0A1X9NFQ3_9GAMM|nr:PilZ domain-containing protein [Oceanicoccus sagamiensis]ARN74705.1 PilZ domain-containing protein [Oceanicoccus sagamiensis]
MKDIIERKHERKELNQSIPILDVINGGEFGELVNATIEGIMIITDKEIPTQSIYQLSLQLPIEIEGSNTVELGADCLWCRKVENFHRYWSGFHIIDASDTAMAQLEELIKHYSK